MIAGNTGNGHKLPRAALQSMDGIDNAWVQQTKSYKYAVECKKDKA